MSRTIDDNYKPEIEEDEALIINPTEIRKRRKIVDSVIPEDEELIQKLERTGNKIYNNSGRTVIEYETMGRFETPEVLSFRDFSVSDINDITLSRNEDLLKNLVVILNDCKNEDADFDVEDMLLEEALETLIGIKLQFNTPIHEHPWICECQQGLEADAQTVNISKIDLTTLQYRSIEEADEKMREYYKPLFDKLTDKQFQEYLDIKYKKEEDKDTSEITKEDEIKSLRIIEPIGFKDDDGNIYSFNFTRLKHLMDAQKMVQFKYAGKVKAIKNKQTPQNSPVAEFKAKKDIELEDVQYQQAKDLILYAKAFALTRYNGKELTKEEAVGIYRKMPRSIMFRVNDFFETTKFGVVDDRELECPQCGQSSRRLLRQEFNPFEFLPLDTASKTKARSSSGLDIFIGV